MAKRAKAKAPTKSQVKAAADRAEASSKKKADAQSESGAARAEAKAGDGGVTRMIAASALRTLMGQVLGYQEQVSTASGNLGDLVRDAAANKHLHRGAFADVKKLYRMGKKDPSKLWLHLAHFDDMRKKLGLDEIAGKQSQLLDAGTGGDDDDETEGETGGQPEPRTPANVSRPKFGAGHPNFGEGHSQVIKDAAAGVGASAPGTRVADLAKAAGASTQG